MSAYSIPVRTSTRLGFRTLGFATVLLGVSLAVYSPHTEAQQTSPPFVFVYSVAAAYFGDGSANFGNTSFTSGCEELSHSYNDVWFSASKTSGPNTATVSLATAIDTSGHPSQLEIEAGYPPQAGGGTLDVYALGSPGTAFHLEAGWSGHATATVPLVDSWVWAAGANGLTKKAYVQLGEGHTGGQQASSSDSVTLNGKTQPESITCFGRHYTFAATYDLGATSVAASGLGQGQAQADSTLTLIGMSGSALTLLSGDQQTGSISTPLPNPLVVKATNPDGSPAFGVSISFAIGQQPGGASGAALTAGTATTGAGGTASTQLTLGDKPGQYQVTASCAAGQTCTPNSVTFTETASPLTLALQSGDQQTGSISSALPRPLVVKATNPDGSPASGAAISFAIGQQPSGAIGAALTTATATTAPDGTAATQLTLGDKTGQYQVSASCAGGQMCTPSSITFSETARPGATLRVSPAALDFGPVGLNLTKTETLSVTNVGAAGSLLTGSIQSPSSPFSIASGGGAFSLASGQTQDVTIAFQSPSVGSFDDNIVVTSNDPSAPSLSIPIHAEIVHKVQLWINAFIPNCCPPLIQTLTPPNRFAGTSVIRAPEPLFQLDGALFFTDQRAFDSDPITGRWRSRLHSELDISFPGPASTDIEQTNPTIEIAQMDPSKPYAIVCEAAPDNSRMHFSSLLSSPTLIQATLDAAANDPCLSLVPTPDVEYQGTVTIDLQAQSVSFNGLIKPFPAYEMYSIVNDYPPQVVFQAFPAPGTDPFSLIGPPTVPASGTAPFTNPALTATSLVNGSTGGASEISVASQTGFSIGDSVSIGASRANNEVRTTTGFGSLKLNKPLLFPHSAGESVIRLPSQVADVTPPSTAAELSVPPNASGWINQVPLRAILVAQDNAGGTGVSRTFYALDNSGCAPPVTGISIPAACQIGNDLAVSGEGRHTLYFFSLDAAGNFEAQQHVAVNVDTSPPVTTATASPPPNAAGWSNQANVAVSLAATDNLSGVARTEFNLDGAGWAAYTAPIVVTAEGKHVLQYRSADIAGNVEVAHQLPINIDRTPPEASLQFDPRSKDIQVIGHDALSGTPSGPVAPSSVTPAQWGKDDEDQELGDVDHHDDDAPRVELRTYQIMDAAGNTLSLVLKVHATRHQLQVRIVSLQYNGAGVSVGRNTERFNWQVDDEHGGSLSHLEQQVRLGTDRDRQSAQADFNAHKNETRIDVEAAGKPDVHVTKPGLVLLQTNTAQGTLSIAY